MGESLDTLRDLLTRSEFQLGLVCGGVALLVISVLPPRWRTSVFRAGWGAVTALAILVGVQRLDGRQIGLMVGLALIAIGGALSDQRSALRARMLGWGLIIGGASVIPARGLAEVQSWVYVATAIAAVLIGTGMAHWPMAEQRWIGPLFAISAFGVWTTVPDTELARLMLGVAIPLAAATLPPLSTPVRRAGAFVLGGVFAWIPALGGEGRPASIIGAWATIGVIAALPAAMAAWRVHLVLEPWRLFTVHVVVVVVAARVIGLWTSAVPALLVAIMMYATTMFVLYELDQADGAPLTTDADR